MLYPTSFVRIFLITTLVNFYHAIILEYYLLFFIYLFLLITILQHYSSHLIHHSTTRHNSSQQYFSHHLCSSLSCGRRNKGSLLGELCTGRRWPAIGFRMANAGYRAPLWLSIQGLLAELLRGSAPLAHDGFSCGRRYK